MSINLKLLVVITFFGIICCVFAKTGDVIFVNIIARHGARTPTWFYENDPNKDKFTKYGPPGSLVEKGKKQTHDLGVWLHKKYGQLLQGAGSSKHPHPDNIKVRTTDVPRVKLSAKCLLNGMIHGKDTVDCTSDIPMESEPKQRDYLLSALAPCPPYKSELERVEKSPEIQAKNKKFEHIYKIIKEKSGSEGIRGDRFEFIEKIYDTVLVEGEFGMKPDDWAKRIMKEMKEASILSYALPSWTDKLKRLKSGPLVGQMVGDMKSKTNVKDKSNHINIKLYMAHDMTIVNFLNTLGLYDQKHLPDYAAFLLLELIDAGKGKHTVKLSYSQTTRPHPAQLLSMSLEQFEQKTKHLIPSDIHKECNAR